MGLARADWLARRVGPERPHARHAGPRPRSATRNGPPSIQMWLNSELQSGPLDLNPDLPEPDRQMGHRSNEVPAATLGYGQGYRLPPPVDRFVDRRFRYSQRGERHQGYYPCYQCS